MFTPTLSFSGTLPSQQLLDTTDDGTGTAPLEGAPVFRLPLPVPVDSEPTPTPTPTPFAPPADAPTPTPPVFRPVPDDPIPQQPVFHPAPTTPAFVSPPVTLVDSPDDPAQHPADTPAGPSATPLTPGVLNPFVHGDPTIPGPTTFVPGTTPTPTTHFSPSNGQRMPTSEILPPPLVPQVSPVIILPAGQQASDSGGLSNGGDSTGTGSGLSPLWMVAAAVAAFVLFLRK